MGASSDRIRVVHVDDDRGSAEATAEFLEGEHDRFVVETVTSASDALDRIATTGIDCVVSEYELPGMDGIKLLEAIRETRPGLPFILYTGTGSEAIASDAISAGVTGYLTKPTGTGQSESLVDRIVNAVEQYEVGRERRQWKQAVETATQGIAIVDGDGTFRRMNDAYAAAYNETPAALVGTNWRDWYPDGELARFEDEILPTLRRDGSWEGESVGCRTGGTEFPQHLSLSLLPTGGHVCGHSDAHPRRGRRRRRLERVAGGAARHRPRGGRRSRQYREGHLRRRTHDHPRGESARLPTDRRRRLRHRAGGQRVRAPRCGRPADLRGHQYGRRGLGERDLVSGDPAVPRRGAVRRHRVRPGTGTLRATAPRDGAPARSTHCDAFGRQGGGLLGQSLPRRGR
ncbi:MAG: hypothetical protein BRD21_01365 [Halobacteriales archaeon SW_8_66_22]|nr:MAG: hypothetical protein BRD21_01365 [Halobacteriales archaeon SW_8_66_22]